MNKAAGFTAQLESSQFELIIFDCDGVLVDSERIANEVFARVLEEECSLSYTLEQMFELFVGNSQARCLQIIEETMDRPLPPDLGEIYHREINAALATSVVAVAGVETVLQSLTLPYCIASSGSHDKMQLTLGKTGLAKYFEDNIFSTSEVERAKPDPDIYLHAAKTMGFAEPQNCLVIEDSPIGTAAGIAAGMTVFGYAEMMGPDRLNAAGAHRTFDNMLELPQLINNFRIRA